jgi:membrane-associated phospholipid phosphatase
VGSYASTLRTYDLTTTLDRAIPLVPAFVWPYELLYVFPFFSLFILRDFRRFDVALIALATANLAAFPVYMSLPVSFPRATLGHSLAERVLALEYAMDFSPGANNLPSMHVAMSWIMGRAMLGQRGRIADALIVAIVFAIALSTVMVKQHVVVDAISGAVFGALAWAFATRVAVDRARAGEQA